jgi:hypothetical protein
MNDHHVRITAFTQVNDSGSFISTTQLNVGVCDLFSTAFRALLVDNAVGLNLVSHHVLDARL